MLGRYFVLLINNTSCLHAVFSFIHHKTSSVDAVVSFLNSYHGINDTMLVFLLLLIKWYSLYVKCVCNGTIFAYCKFI